jgi:signal transduction histidine kinase
VQPAVSVFPLAAFLEQIATTHEPVAQQKGLAFRVSPTRLLARTDSQLLRQLVANLVANAIRYTNRGGLLIGVRRRDGKLWIEVWDTGIGIPADKHEEIFEPFHQLGNSARDREHGTGLGLALVQRLAKVLGLPLRVSSRLALRMRPLLMRRLASRFRHGGGCVWRCSRIRPSCAMR